METAPAAMSSLLPKLDALLRDEHKLHTRGLRRGIVSLREKLQKFGSAAIILDASETTTGEERRPADDDDTRKLRELSYDMEDSVDELMVRVGRQPPPGVGGRWKRLLAEVKARSRVGKRIRRLEAQLEKLVSDSEQCTSYQASSSSSGDGGGADEEGAASSTIVEGEDDAGGGGLVGVDRPRDELIAKLQLVEKGEEETTAGSSAARLKVVSIVGSGGLGKTTLAREVYHAIQSRFGCSAWVSVSRNPNMESILMGILRQVEDDPHSSSSGAADAKGERELITRIRRSLQGKSYLLVLDDIWSTKTWEVIKSAFPLDTCGSRVITTTCVRAVAASCCSDWTDYIYDVVPLSSKDSWSFFYKRIIGSTGRFPSHLEGASDKILERCSGVPLAIITMSGLLASNPVREDVFRKILPATPEGAQGMREILLLSYTDLPRHLKVCFLYLSIFPEGHPINYDHIIRCWIAEGFISEDDDDDKRSPEEVGESYLNELITRSMIQPIRGSYDGKPESFLIHGVMLELIKSRSIRDNFVTLLNSEEPLPMTHRKIRRMSIVNNVNEDHEIPAPIDISHIRSLHIFGGVGTKLMFKHLRFLRVLNLDGFKGLQQHHTFDMIPGLLSLRYLRIRDTYLERIPEWFIPLPRLAYLSIDIEEVKNQDLQLLSKLDMLLHLSLSSKIRPTEKLVISRNGFPVLRYFHLSSARADLTFEPQAMQKLEVLRLTLDVLPETAHGPISIASDQFMRLKNIDIRINGEGAAASQLFKATDDAIRKAAAECPNPPVINTAALRNLDEYAVKDSYGLGN